MNLPAADPFTQSQSSKPAGLPREELRRSARHEETAHGVPTPGSSRRTRSHRNGLTVQRSDPETRRKEEPLVQSFDEMAGMIEHGTDRWNTMSDHMTGHAPEMARMMSHAEFEATAAEDSDSGRVVVGDMVQVVDGRFDTGCRKWLGEIGRVIVDDGSAQPYQIEGFLDHLGKACWFFRETVIKVAALKL